MSATPLRIGYLVQQFPPEVGAGPARVTEMALRWQERGAVVTIVTGMPARAIPGRAFGEGDPAYDGKAFLEEDFKGLRVLRSWSYKARKPGFARVIANNLSFMVTSFSHALARLGEVDVLIASSPPLFPHIAGAGVAAIRGVPLVLEIRDLWPDYLVDMGLLSPKRPATRALFALERSLIRRASLVAVVTDSFRERVVGKGAPPERVDVFPNGVDLSQYYSDRSRVPLPALGKRDGEFLAGYLGTFGAGQDLTSIADAAALLAKSDPTVRIVLAGDGLQRQQLAERVAALHIHNLTVLPPIPKTETRAFYNSCDLCLVPLAPIPVFQETVPSKIFEIMACERPILASLDGEGRRIIERSSGGMVVPPGNARAIADGILSMKALPGKAREEQGRRGRAFVAEHYDRIHIADRYLERMRGIAGRRVTV